MNHFVFELLLNKLPQSIFWKDTNLQFQGCNQSFANQFGFESSDALIGKTDYHLPITKELAEKYRADDLEVIQTLKPKINCEEETMTATGEKRFVAVSKYPCFNDSRQILGILGIFTDITELRTAEEQARMAIFKAEKANALAIAEKEMRKTVMVLVGDIVHDLRTPIATIRTATDILDKIVPTLLQMIEQSKDLSQHHLDLLNKKEWDYLSHGSATTAIKHSISIMDDFINTTLLELKTSQEEFIHNLSKQNLTKCSSRRVIENALDAFIFADYIVVNRNISYDFYFMGNPILMIKVLFNIFRNAVEQIQLHKRGEITVITEKTEGFNVIKVKDTAGGASVDVVNNMFNGYFSTKERGTGIGLTFCKKMMLNFGGDITCDTLDGEWIEFTLLFPQID